MLANPRAVKCGVAMEANGHIGASDYHHSLNSVSWALLEMCYQQVAESQRDNDIHSQPMRFSCLGPAIATQWSQLESQCLRGIQGSGSVFNIAEIGPEGMWSKY